MKKVLQIVLGIVIVVLAYVLFKQVSSPLDFQTQMKGRESAVIEKIKDIRSAERAYRQVHQKFTGDFDSLIYFLLTDSMVFEKSIGSADDSVAVAKGLVKKEKFKVAVKDTVFTTKKTIEQIKDLASIPYGEGKKYILGAAMFSTESSVVVPVVEIKAPYSYFLADLDNQELVNLIDERNSVNKYPGVKVGALDQATNEAGNWE